MTTKHFIIVDDDPAITIINKLLITKFDSTAKVTTFTDPLAGFKYLADSPPQTTPAILFLDINMPLMTGWDFLEQFHLLDPDVKNKFTVFIVSSSLDPIDKRKAADNVYVKDYIVKPLSLATLNALFVGDQ
jgi:two-component SAPR family response regulator